MARRAKVPKTGRLSALPSVARHAALAQSAERFTRNEQVVGSIPTGGSRVSAGQVWFDRLHRTPF